MKTVVVGNHVIFGDWDDTYGAQVLVYYHTNRRHCDVFVMEGIDYGGGIDRYATGLLADDVDELVESSKDAYDFHKKVTSIEPLKWKDY